MLRSAEIIVFSILSLFCFALGTVKMAEELRALPPNFDLSNLMQLASVDRVESVAGASNLTNMDALQLCYLALSHPAALQMRYLPDKARDAVPSRCLRLSLSVGQQSPLNAFAWAVGAMAAASIGDWTRFNTLLASSQSANPTQNWLATLRIQLGLAHLDNVDEAAGQSLFDDMEMLAQSEPGAALLAVQYVRAPGAREYMRTALEATSAENQRRFVNAVRRAGSQ